MVEFLTKDFKLALESKKNELKTKLLESQLDKIAEAIINKLGKAGDVVNVIEDIEGFIKQSRVVKKPVDKIEVNSKVENNNLIIDVELYSKREDGNYELISNEELNNYGINKEDLTSKLEDLVKILPDVKQVTVNINNYELNIPITTEVDTTPILNVLKKEVYNELPVLSDMFLKEVKSKLAEKDLTPEQEERYRIKYEAALKAKDTGDYSLFELEAKLVGMKPEDLVDLIISTGNNWKAKITELSIIIDGVRVALQRRVSEIENIDDLNNIPKIIKELRELGIDITVSKALEIIESYLG